MASAGFVMAGSGALMRLTENVFQCLIAKILFEFILSSFFSSLELQRGLVFTTCLFSSTG